MTDRSAVPLQVDLLIKNAFVITMDAQRHIVPDGAIAICGHTIALVGPTSEVAARVEPKRTIDAAGGQVHPGFVECHAHATFHLLRGAFGDSCSLAEFGAKQRPFVELMDDEIEHASAVLAGVEMVRNGTTCFLEAGTAFSPDAAAAAAEEVGIRALLGDPFIQDVTPVTGGQGEPGGRLAARSLEQSLDLLGGQLSRNRDPDALVRGHVALIGMGTASDELTLAAKALADRENVVLNQHQSCERADADADDRRFGKHPLVHQEEIGLLGPNCVFGHMNILREDELEPIVRSGVSLAWCPAASMIWGFGGTIHGHHAELLRSGANIALGSDTSNFANAFDIGLEAYLAVLTAREKHMSRDVLDTGDALAMATINGARAVGLEHMIGSLEPGKRADLVIRALDVPEQFPLNDLISELIFSSGAKSIHSVIIDGRVVLEDRQPTRVDAPRVYESAERIVRKALGRAERHTNSKWPVLERVLSDARTEDQVS